MTLLHKNGSAVAYPSLPWHTKVMPKRKRPRDLNQLAKFIVDVSTGEAELPECQPDGKNPAAVELGKLGGKKGGTARADKLTPEQRQEIARRAAQARWKKSSSERGA
jgi:hypothetical protein